VFLNVLKGNVGKLIAEEFVNFQESDYRPLISYEDIFSGTSISAAMIERIRTETHSRLYLSAKNILKSLDLSVKSNQEEADPKTDRFIELLRLYPIDLRIGIMKDIRNSYPEVYRYAIEKEVFVELYFEAFSFIKG
ncbi:MAG: ATPase family protein associated with various cellular, partial [Herbinix sp.]|nr:ATPase family protein associated with various cellular [Herbinix sp.]